MLQSCAQGIKVLEGYANSRVRDVKTEQLFADCEVGKERISASFTVENTKYQESRGMDETTMLNNAVYEAMRTVDADELIGLQFKMTSEYDQDKKTSKYVITVSGYPVWYRNFRPVEKERIDFDVKELKPDTPYIIVEKDNKVGGKGYRVVSTKVKQEALVPVVPFDTENMEMDKVELKKKEVKSKNKK